MAGRSRRPPGRGLAVLRTVYDCTLALITEKGYVFSIEEVAERAAVHKTTIYRRWPSKAALIGAAVQQIADTQIAIEHSGDPVSDLTNLAVLLARWLRTAAGIHTIRAVMSAVGDDPALEQVVRDFLAGRYGAARDLIEEAIQTGQIAEGVDPDLMWRAMVNPLHLGALTGEPASDGTAVQLVALVLDGARPATGKVRGQPA